MNTDNKKSRNQDSSHKNRGQGSRNRNRPYRKPYNKAKPSRQHEDKKPDDKKTAKKSTNIRITRPAEGNENWQKGLKTTLLWVTILVSVFFFAQLLNTESAPVKKLAFTEYRELLDAGKIKSALLIKNHFHGELKAPEYAEINGVETEYVKFFVVLSPVIDSEVLATWDAMGIDYEFQDETRDWVDYLFQILPWILIIFFWFFLMRRMQAGGGTKGIFSFGKSRAKIIDNENPETTFKDVEGCDEAKEELREIVQFLKHPERFQRLGGKIPKGALLVGPPGTGKTLLAKAVAGEASVPFYSLSGADFVEMFVGVGASRVRDLFEQSKKSAPCIIFIDELDAVGRQRGAGLGGGHDEREQTLNALLVEMDGFETTDNIILLAATNRPDVLDSALLRPGRFDRRITVDIPDVRGREAILRVHSKNIPLAKNVRLDIIAKGTPGMSGADLANLMNEAALIAAKHRKQRVAMIDIENAKDKIMMGTERRSMIINEKEKKTTAVHESGHALVARYTKGADPVHRVTIIPRGGALGLTAQLPVDDRYNYSLEFMEGMLAILMGGRVAEEVVLKQMTTGAGNDIERATSLARKMVTQWGMSEKMGPMTYGQKKEEIFIGRELGMHRDFSEDMAKKIDIEIRRVIDKAYKAAKTIVTEHEDKLLKITAVLLEKETIDGKQLDRIIGLPQERPKRNENRPQGSRPNQSSHPRPPRKDSPSVEPKSDITTTEVVDTSASDTGSEQGNQKQNRSSRPRTPRKKPTEQAPKSEDSQPEPGNEKMGDSPEQGNQRQNRPSRPRAPRKKPVEQAPKNEDAQPEPGNAKKDDSPEQPKE